MSPKPWRILLAREKAQLINKIADFLDYPLEIEPIVSEETLYKAAKLVTIDAEKKDFLGYTINTKDAVFNALHLDGMDNVSYRESCAKIYDIASETIKYIRYVIKNCDKQTAAQAKKEYFILLEEVLETAKDIEKYGTKQFGHIEILENRIFLNRLLEVEAKTLIELSGRKIRKYKAVEVQPHPFYRQEAIAYHKIINETETGLNNNHVNKQIAEKNTQNNAVAKKSGM